MAQHYIGFITDALMEFDGVDPTNAMVRQSYEALAWQGLGETVLWKNMPAYEKLSFVNLINLLTNGRSKCN